MDEQKDIPNLQVPFGRPRHVGYCLSCYLKDSPVYSIPIAISGTELRGILGSKWIGDALSKEEFAKICKFLIGTMELCWKPALEFVIEGMNLPRDWDWD